MKQQLTTFKPPIKTRKFLSIPLLVAMFLASSVFSNTAIAIPISGKVVDANGEPLIGASISIKGTGEGTITDVDGNFSLECTEGSTLVISYTWVCRTGNRSNWHQPSYYYP